MTRITTNATNNVSGKVALFWTFISTMTNLTTILTSLILVITKSTVEGSQVTKLITLVLVLTFGNGGSLWDEC